MGAGNFVPCRLGKGGKSFSKRVPLWIRSSNLLVGEPSEPDEGRGRFVCRATSSANQVSPTRAMAGPPAIQPRRRFPLLGKVGSKPAECLAELGYPFLHADGEGNDRAAHHSCLLAMASVIPSSRNAGAQQIPEPPPIAP